MFSRLATWRVAAEVIVILAVAESGSAQQNQAQPPQIPSQLAGETLTIGTSTLRLGMSKDSVISALATQYDVIASDRAGLDASIGGKPDGRHYLIMAVKSSLVGMVEFDDRGKLVAADKTWTPEPGPHSEGEIGRAIYALIATLVSEGERACSIDATQRNSDEPPGRAPRYIGRLATIQCGEKRILIGVSANQKDGTDSISIDEQIGNLNSTSK
jgi:hypothetical protein